MNKNGLNQNGYYDFLRYNTKLFSDLCNLKSKIQEHIYNNNNYNCDFRLIVSKDILDHRVVSNIDKRLVDKDSH